MSFEGKPNIPKGNSEHEAAEKRHGSPEDPHPSEELRAFADKCANLSTAQRNELMLLADKIADGEKKSRTDEVTGLLNRRGYYEEVERLQAVFARERIQHPDADGQPSALLFF
jgi:GGDEF domain-containing protein